ncbi:hypothetical protein MJO28_012073 [Puccinia striiformis f. sp. tritici]|uniref:Uncharacterized protein n=1 Tax=Puccinia striiformis f. sp. tritici TaxID=168172 RepID=A0ACC0E075_9BASI|nr:hypothetical protein MJO28_012073 [Puccinia striiformis f. sp. tritici]
MSALPDINIASRSVSGTKRKENSPSLTDPTPENTQPFEGERPAIDDPGLLSRRQWYRQPRTSTPICPSPTTMVPLSRKKLMSNPPSILPRPPLGRPSELKYSAGLPPTSDFVPPGMASVVTLEAK